MILSKLTDIELPAISEDLGLATASLKRGKVAGFSELNITELCVVESEKNGSFYSAVKLPQVNGGYDARYN